MKFLIKEKSSPACVPEDAPMLLNTFTDKIFRSFELKREEAKNLVCQGVFSRSQDH